MAEALRMRRVVVLKLDIEIGAEPLLQLPPEFQRVIIPMLQDQTRQTAFTTARQAYYSLHMRRNVLPRHTGGEAPAMYISQRDEAADIGVSLAAPGQKREVRAIRERQLRSKNGENVFFAAICVELHGCSKAVVIRNGKRRHVKLDGAIDQG